MNYFAKKNTLIWIIIILFAINVAAITTIIIFMGSARNHSPLMMEKGKPSTFINKELGLSPNQSRNFDLMHSEFSEKSLGIIQELDSLRYEMMNELSKEEPDSLKLDKIADKIGLWHATLKKETIRHFVQIRRNCNVEQRRSLSKIYRKMQEPPERGFGRNWKEGESRKINSRNSNRSGNRERGQMNRRNKDNQ
jgi:hypothetical protein